MESYPPEVWTAHSNRAGTDTFHSTHKNSRSCYVWIFFGIQHQDVEESVASGKIAQSHECCFIEHSGLKRTQQEHRRHFMAILTSVELCAGAGGQALGLEKAGFGHEALVEIDAQCRETLSLNRPGWNVIEGEQADLAQFNGSPYKGIDILAGGLPCPPFSIAGKQLGANDERNLSLLSTKKSRRRPKLACDSFVGPSSHSPHLHSFRRGCERHQQGGWRADILCVGHEWLQCAKCGNARC